MRAYELMTRYPTCATPTTSAEEVAQLMATKDCGCVPVVDRANRVIGVVTDRDIAVRGVARGKSPNTRVGDLMSHDVVCCSQDAHIDDVERLMSDRQVRRVVIADADGCCIGIVSQGDLARAAGLADLDPADVGHLVEHISQPKSSMLRGKPLDGNIPGPRYGSGG